MTADWAAEAGAESPSIDVPWDGWTNLSWGKAGPASPWQEARALALPEVQRYPELLSSLQELNSGLFLTSKVDVFPVALEDVDPEIADGCPAGALGLGSYIDVLQARPAGVVPFELCEATARATARALAAAPDLAGGAEIVIRPASLGGLPAFGWPLYAFGFGAGPPAARAAWAQACGLLTTAFAAEAASVHTRRSRAILDKAPRAGE